MLSRSLNHNESHCTAAQQPSTFAIVPAVPLSPLSGILQDLVPPGLWVHPMYPLLLTDPHALKYILCCSRQEVDKSDVTNEVNVIILHYTIKTTPTITHLISVWRQSTHKNSQVLQRNDSLKNNKRYTEFSLFQFFLNDLILNLTFLRSHLF